MESMKINRMKEQVYYNINPKYWRLKEEIRGLHQHFNEEGTTLRNSRNHLKTNTWQGTPICIKSFKQPNLFNQWMYGHHRGSKAKRSFLYAKKLQKLNIHTPDPIAYIECKNFWGGLTHSYYIYEYEATDMRISDLPNLNLSHAEKTTIINALVQFTCSHLYDNYIYNKDFNGSNILVNRRNNIINLSFIDINRLRFKHHMSAQHELSNLNMLSDDPEILCLIGKAYAKVRNIEEKQTTYALFTSKYFRKKHRQTRKKITRPFKEIGTHLHKQLAN